MHLAIALLITVVLAGCGTVPKSSDPASDAPDRQKATIHAIAAPASYAAALATWRAPEDINAWIGARFEYDGDRALLLSETQRASAKAPAIHEPGAFFDRPVGICVDLARFGVETLRAIAPELEPRYLMVEFSPTLRAGQVLRRHWIATFQRADGFYFFADSKYPGVLEGPYPSVEFFVARYATVRHREIVAHRLLDSHRKQPKSLLQRKPRDGLRLLGA